MKFNYQGVKPNYKKYLRDLVLAGGTTPALIHIDCMFDDDVVNNTLPHYNSLGIPSYNTFAPKAKSRTSGVTTDWAGSLSYSDDGEGSQLITGNYVFQRFVSVGNRAPAYNAYTFSIWIKPSAIVNAAAANQAIVQLYYSVNTEGAWYIALGSSTGNLTNEYISIINTGLEFGGGPVTNKRTGIADGGNLAANTWVNLTFCWNAVQGRYDIYKDNVLYTNYVTTTGVNSGHVPALANPEYYAQANDVVLGGLIGGAAGVSGNSRIYFNGRIAAFWLYDSVLTTNELTYNYNSFKDRF
jgi:hypothetical protein